MASVKDPDPAEENPAPARPEIITPLSVPPGTPGSIPPPTRRSTRIKVALLATAFVLLVGGGLWLLNYLADRPAQRTALQTPVGKPDPPYRKQAAGQAQGSPQTIVDPASIAAEKQQAEKHLAEFLKLKQKLETKGVSQWGNETLSLIHI